MSYERRPDRRPGGRPGGGRPDRGQRQRGSFGGDRPPRDRGTFGGDRPPRPGGFRQREDEGGMSIRLDPRRLSALKLLAAEAGVRPGELVTSWVEERLDAARAGRPVPAPAGGGASAEALAELAARVDELARRLDAVASEPRPAPVAEAAETPDAQRQNEPARPKAARRRRGQPRGDGGAPRVPLHEEIAAVIRERGPLKAAEIAEAVSERGRYSPPRSNRPLDAATVHSRISNPAYRARFKRSDGRIDLA